tara:strand:- start:497 stop:1228 length:732 start_codon:yes stop_codon:yes gene_type:complete
MIKDSLNFPLIPIEITSNVLGRIAITRIALEKAISQMAEHASIGVMRNALVDAYRASDSDVASLFNSFSGTNADKYRETIAILNADNPEKSDIIGFDHKAYQADYALKLAIIKSKITYTLEFKDSFDNTIGGFLPFSQNLSFDKNIYTCLIGNNARVNTNLVLSIKQTSTSVVGKYYISDKNNFFRTSGTVVNWVNNLRQTRGYDPANEDYLFDINVIFTDKVSLFKTKFIITDVDNTNLVDI